MASISFRDPAMAQIAGLFNQSSVTYQEVSLTQDNCAQWARAENPCNGFEAFEYQFEGTTTRVRYFDSPEALGNLGRDLVSHWPAGAVGLALFFNEQLGTAGATFVTTASKCTGSPWAKIFGREFVWQAFGGTMFVNDGNFLGTLKAHMDKSVAMDRKGRFIDASLLRVGKPQTGLGGSKSCFTMEDPTRGGTERGAAVIRNYGWFQRLLGINITGGDQGFGVDENAITTAVAPENFCNSPLTGGYDPTANTAPGIIRSIERVWTYRQQGSRRPQPASILIQGFGGVGSRVGRHFRQANGTDVFACDVVINHAIAEIFSGDAARRFVLDISARRPEHFIPATLFEKEVGIASLENLVRFAEDRGWAVRNGLVECLGMFPNVSIFAPCASVHPLMQGVRQYIANSKISHVYGSVNNTHETGPDGTVRVSAWDMRDADVHVECDSRLNRGGATGVVGKLCGLTEEDMNGQADAVAQDTFEAWEREQDRHAVPSQLEGDHTATLLSHRNIDKGLTVGARLPLPPMDRAAL